MAALEQVRSYWDARARAALTDNERIDSTGRSQRARFADVVRALGNAGSVLDVGCGVGDLFGYLREHRPGVQYMGVDRRYSDGRPWNDQQHRHERLSTYIWGGIGEPAYLTNLDPDASRTTGAPR